MNQIPAFNPRGDAPKPRSEPGPGDDAPCVKCGGALDTGLECTECGLDNYEAVTGKPFGSLRGFGVTITPGGASDYVQGQSDGADMCADAIRKG